MRIAPEIARLQGDASPLLAGCAAAAAAVQAWQREEAVMLRELGAYAAGASLDSCRRLRALFAGAHEAGHEAGHEAARASIEPMLAVLREHRLAQLPQRHFSNGVLHSVTLALAGEASLSLALIDAAAWEASREPGRPDAVSFQPGVLHARVLAGSAAARRVRIVRALARHATLACEPMSLVKGVSYCLDGSREALVFDGIGASLIVLRLHRHAADAAAARQYDRATGALLHQAAANRRDSRAEMIMALLRRMERADAAPVVAQLSREGAPASRWQALRECLALDSGTGLMELAGVARQAGDPLQHAASQLLDALAAQSAAFARAREELLCPA